jgi:hypothetical protein
MLFDHVGHQKFIHHHVFDVEEKTVFVLIQMVQANGTLEPMLDSWKSDGPDGTVIVAASRCPPGLIFILLNVVFLGCLLHSCLLGRLLLSRLFFPLFNPHFEHLNLNVYEWVHLVIKMEIIKHRSMT